MIEIGEILELDDNKEYIVINAKKAGNNRYLFLLSNYKPAKVLFAKELDAEGNLEIINNQTEKLEVFNLFQNDLSID